MSMFVSKIFHVKQHFTVKMRIYDKYEQDNYEKKCYEQQQCIKFINEQKIVSTNVTNIVVSMSVHSDALERFKNELMLYKNNEIKIHLAEYDDVKQFTECFILTVDMIDIVMKSLYISKCHYLSLTEQNIYNKFNKEKCVVYL